MHLKEYGITYVKSFFSMPHYGKVAYQWKGWGFAYLFFVMVLLFSLLAFSMVRFALGVQAQDIMRWGELVLAQQAERENMAVDRAYVQAQLTRLLRTAQQLPVMQVRGENLYVNAQTPVAITDSYTQRTWLMIAPETEEQAKSQQGIEVILGQREIWYRNEAKHWSSIAYGELYRGSQSLNEENINRVLKFLASFPPLLFEDDRLSMATSSPYVLAGSSYGGDWVVDTREATKALTPDDAVIFGATSLYFWSDQGEKRSLAYIDITENVVEKYVGVGLEYIKRLFYKSLTVIVPAMALFSYGVAMLLVLLFGTIGLGIAAILQVRGMEYQQLVRIACVAFTPVATCYTLAPKFPGSGLIYFLIMCGYMFFALRSIKQGKSF